MLEDVDFDKLVKKNKECHVSNLNTVNFMFHLTILILFSINTVIIRHRGNLFNFSLHTTHIFLLA